MGEAHGVDREREGVTIFRQEDVEVPKSWSQTATNIVTSKYFHGKPGTPQREGSVRQLIGRVVNTLCGGAKRAGILRTGRREMRSAMS